MDRGGVGEAGVPATTALAEALGHRFRDPTLLERALAHPSYAHEADGSRGNERLEFLGDAVLDLAVAHLLYEARSEWHEGELTRARAALVNQRTLAARARALDLGRFVKLGRTEQRSHGARKDSILANCFEAVIGAVYLDGGFPAAAAAVRRVFDDLAAGTAPSARDAKTAFQEFAHARFRITPHYRTVEDSGTEDDDERFTVEVAVEHEVWGRGIGRTKRAAERAAAAAALARAERDA